MTRPEEPQESGAPPHMEETATATATATASPARSDKSSDSEGRPVREKLQETRIDTARQPPSGSDSDRGRLRRKRSREALDDGDDDDAHDDAHQPDRKHEKLEQTTKPARHTRKRSRDMKSDADSGALAMVPTMDEADAEIQRDSIHKNKRTRDQVEATIQQPAAHDAPASGTSTPRADDERETKRPRDKDEAQPAAEQKPTSATKAGACPRANAHCTDVL
jgi:Ran-binding protein 3